MPGLDPISIGGAGLGLVGGIAGLIQAGSANAQLNKLIGQDPTYGINPVATQRLSLASALLNARMPGAAPAERNILESQANQMATIGRNASSGSQLIAAGAGAQGTTNKALEELNEQEAQDYQRRYGNVVGAQQGMIEEGNKVYQDQVRRFQDLAQIRAAQNANKVNAFGNISNLGFSALNFGLVGGFRKRMMQSLPGSTTTAPPMGFYGGVGDTGD